MDLRMATGDGANSYAANSRLQVCPPSINCNMHLELSTVLTVVSCTYCAVVQKKALQKTKPVLQKAIQDLYYKSLSRRGRSTMVVADLGCSSGPNTLLVVTR